MFTQAFLGLVLQSPSLVPGLYATDRGQIYAGFEAEPPDRRTIQYFDPKTRRTGTLQPASGTSYETIDTPTLKFTFFRPLAALKEHRFTISDGGGTLGVSLWHLSSLVKRPTIVLVHGADDETRDMGFIIPYFAAHGLNVVTYDQRGTGQSAGDWRYTSPQSKANDVIAILESLKHQAGFDPSRVGVWGFSNGGWVAPIVATRYPIAFLILKSPAAESIVQNVLYEIEGTLREHAEFSDAQIAAALDFERLMFRSVSLDQNWQDASAALAAARTEPWFSYMRIPPELPIPPPPPVLAGLRAALIYDPTAVLKVVRTPTLALFGTLDKNVDAPDSSARLRGDFQANGNRHLTVRVFPDADHTLSATTTGYEDEPLQPRRFVSGYPEAVIEWLKVRGIVPRTPYVKN